MCRCHADARCHGCRHAVDRRRFLQTSATTVTTAVATATVGGLSSPAAAADETPRRKVRVAAVFLANTTVRESWPYPGFDAAGRQREILALLAKGCPEIEFIPVSVEKPADAQKALAMKDDVDGYLVYLVTLDWGLGGTVIQIGQLGKPLLVADEFLGGCGTFLTRYSELCDRQIPAAAVSTTRLSDLATVAGQFASVRAPGATPASFARQCEQVYRETFPARGDMRCTEDRLSLTDVGRCVERFRRSRFLIVGRGRGGQEEEFLGARARYVDFDELSSFYEKVDRDEAAEWGGRWRRRATRVMEPQPDAIDKAGVVYLATKLLMEQHGTDSVTMNCLGGFAAGKLPAYPCLGFMQILDDGGQGVCEAMPDDTLSMLMARILTGRPGYVSDPALDTSKNQVVYAHCVATTRPFGPQGQANGFRIRTLHNRDPRGACAESLLPAGYMTTSFRTNVARKQMILHQAKAVGTLDSDHGCRTKLVGEVCGDIGKLFQQWSRFGWHRVTVYGDLKQPLAEFGKALGLEVIEEAV
ncbi:MAG: hypothetical protein JXB62_15255 [Pirellulales bacterium]|nr:hypothetical protein [Pirellulales bacterium]